MADCSSKPVAVMSFVAALSIFSNLVVGIVEAKTSGVASSSHSKHSFQRRSAPTSQPEIIQKMRTRSLQEDTLTPPPTGPTGGIAPSPTPTPIATIDFSPYGYAYSQDASNGFLTFPPEADPLGRNTMYFDSADNVTSAEICASRCASELASAGAWNTRDRACWCYLTAVSLHCKEPCIQEVGVEFSVEDFESLGICEKSFCDEEWYYDPGYCDDVLAFDSAACDAKIAALTSVSTGETPSSPTTPATIDLTAYGYPYAQNASNGFIIFPREADPLGLNALFLDSTSNITSVESCAARCSSVLAKAGAWNTREEGCWCYFVEIGMYCKEPCVEDDGIEFSIEDFNYIGFCPKSYCDEEWYYDPVYCDNVKSFDSWACDAKIAALDESDFATFGTDSDELKDFSSYGYPYSMDSSLGFQTYPPNFGQDQLFFGSADGVNNSQQCAAKCQELDASSGAWVSQWCWCYFSQVEICKEPCLVEDGVEFSRTPLENLSYCKKSICDEEWYYVEYQEYCDVTHNFDGAACDAKIAGLIEGVPPSTVTTTMATSSTPQVVPDDGVLDNFSIYGFPYSMNASEGFQSFPPGFGEDQLSFNATNAVTDARSCAAKCQELDASSGAWNPRWESCWCYFSQLEICKEPCLEEVGVEFSRTPLTDLSYCEKSLCDSEWYYTDYQEYCDVDMGFDSAACDAKIATLNQGPTSSMTTTTTTTAAPQEPGTDDGQPDDFSMYGYPYSMDAAEGYQTFPPGFGEDQLSFNATNAVTDARSCAAKCQELDASSGAWNPRWESCWCYFSQLEICKEPCLEEVGVEFSRTPLTDLSYCEKSLCDSEWYYTDYQEYCDVDMGFDSAACDAKIAALSDQSLSSATSTPPLKADGITINECTDTLALFGDSEQAKAFASVIDCDCAGDLSSNYTMKCKTENYCFEYNHGRACVDILFTYFLEIDQSTGLLPYSGFVKRSTCTTYVDGNGPGTGNSTQCKESNPQCELALKQNHFLFSRQAITICSNQELCPSFFVELGYDNATAAKFCPTTYLDNIKCLTGANQICGIGAPGFFDQDDFSDLPVFIATADCSNVTPCAASICRQIEISEAENPKAIRNGPIYPQCIVPTDAKNGSDDSLVTEVLDVFMRDMFAKFPSGVESDMDTACGGICDSEPESECLQRSRLMYIQDYCYPRNDLVSDEPFGSIKYRLDGTNLCKEFYSDQHCQVTADTQDDCTGIEDLESCNDDGIRWKFIKGHCIKSTTPVDDFVVPIIEAYVFNSDEDCVAKPVGDAFSFILQHVPNDPGSCFKARNPQPDLTAPQLAGGVRAFCDHESGDFINEFYSNTACTERDLDIMYRSEAVFGSCRAHSYPELGFDQWIRYGVHGCKQNEKSQYYCKDFAEAGLAISVQSPLSVNPTTPPSPEAIVDETTDAARAEGDEYDSDSDLSSPNEEVVDGFDKSGEGEDGLQFEESLVNTEPDINSGLQHDLSQISGFSMYLFVLFASLLLTW